MENEEYVLPAAVSISAEAADKLLAGGSGDAALLYIYILKNGGKLNLRRVESSLKLAGGAENAWKKLCEMGLVSAPAGEKDGSRPEEKSADEQAGEHGGNKRGLVSTGDVLPDYTSGDAKTLVRENPEFSNLVGEVENILGTVLSANALIDLMGFYDYLGLSADVIVLLVTWCVSEHEKKYGEGKRPTMRAIRTQAYRWADNGALTLEAAGEYLKKLEQTKQRKREIRRSLGLNDRALSSTEERYISEWAELGLENDMISGAYDKTVLNTGRMAWKYMDSILKSWAQQGFCSMEDVQAGDKKPASAQKTQKPASEGSGREELNRMKEYLDKLRQS